MLALKHIALHGARLSRSVIEIKRALCLYIIVSPVSQRVVFANQYFCAASGELGRRELLFVVFLKGWSKITLHRVVFEYRFDRFADICELNGVNVDRQVGCGGLM